MSLTKYVVATAALAASVSASEIGDGIIGGQPAGDYPWLASMQDGRGFHYCGASLITPTVVLTAAHCVSDGSANFNLRLGSKSTSSGGELIPAKRVFVHEAYDRRTIRNDIALVELSRPSAITPVNLDKSSSSHQSGTAVVAGWGNTRQGTGRPVSPSSMLEVTLPLRDFNTCGNAGPVFANGLKPEMICSGYDSLGENLQKGSCNGDSGGPFFQGNTQIGLVSWGVEGCVSYSIFTKVNSYTAWIQDKLDRLGSTTPGNEKRCTCVGAGFQVNGKTLAEGVCGTHQGIATPWCYTDEDCVGATKSGVYDNLWYFDCDESIGSKFALAQAAAEGISPYNPSTYEFPTFSTSEKSTPAATTPSEGVNTDILIGAGVGALFVGFVAAGGFVIYKKQRDQAVDEAIDRVENERRIISNKA